MLPPNARLLVQAGASDASLARDYRALYPASCTLVVEADPARAQQARDYAERVYVADLDTASPAFYQQLELADGWYFDATLEQFANPLQVLQQVRKVIQPDACIIARIANRLYWDAPATPPRHAWAVGDMLALLQQSGFRIDNGVLLNPAPLPAAIEALLRQQAAASGTEPELLLDAAQPSHYLIKAVPA
jgi:hypothetical protein